MVHENVTVAPNGRRFTALVRAEDLPTRLNWRTRDTVAVVAVPAIFISGWVVNSVFGDPAIAAVCDALLRMLIFAVLVWFNARLLARHWRAFWRAKWRSIGLTLAGVVAIQVVVSVLGALLRGIGGSSSGDDGATSAQPDFALWVLLVASLAPTFTALIEDFVFRHTLMLKIPVWRNVVLSIGLVVVNALVFGAIHINNFGGNLLLTLSYAGAGLLMNLVYLWTRNIWHVLLMHAINNFVLAGPVLLLFAYSLGAY